MFKKTFLIASLSISTLLQAQAPMPLIKLSCNVVIKKQSNGVLERMNQKTILIDVGQNEKSLFIMSTDDDMRSLTTEKASHIAEVTNYSSDTRWHLVNKSNDDKPVLTKIMIDRNSGQLLYTQEFNSANTKLFTEITGTCSKVDMQIKKF